MKKKVPFFLLGILLCVLSTIAYGQTNRIYTGTVQDSTGNKIAGVSVAVKGTHFATTSDLNGNFKITAPEGSLLSFSLLGYKDASVRLDQKLNLSVVLRTVMKDLNEVVVTSMGIQRQARSLGYAISSVSAKDLTASASPNFASALYGKAAGVKIVSSPGGASSAVWVQIRGVSSVNGNTQPLYIVDGVPIRVYNELSGTSGTMANNNGYWDNQRIQGNGILDINPEDIESLTVLKGASASALYGSEAMNGVVVITTKRGYKKKGLGVDLSYAYTNENLAYSPDYQNEYGPGYDQQTNVAYGIADADGWVSTADSTRHPYYGSYTEFGPKFDGSTVKYWDGTYRKYEAQKHNFRDFFQNGYNSSVNLSFGNSSENGSYRFSINREDYRSIMPGSNLYKNNFSFNGTLKLSPKVSLDIISTFNNNFTHNRAYLMSQIFGAYAGFFSRFDDMHTFLNRYKTTDGYYYVSSTNTSYDQDQKMTYSFRATNIMSYLWTQLRNSYDETQNRFLNSATLTAEILPNLKFRGRISADMTYLNTVDKEHNTEPSSVGYTGSYSVGNRNYNIFYTDLLLIYAQKINKDLNLTATGGLTGRQQKTHYQTTSTASGLVDENFFNFTNSAGTVTSSETDMSQIDVAAFGIINLNWKNLLYVEGTGRYESTSTLPSSVNEYFYPSFNAGFILSDAVKMPSFISYAKIRGSYGLVGNHPGIYEANVAYNQKALTYNSSSVIYQYANASEFGNDKIQSERKRESEIGLETRLFGDRIGVDLSYYNNKVDRQILWLSTPASLGATSVLANAGDLANYGVEAAFTAKVLSTKNFHWIARFNFAVNKNKLVSLPNNMSTLSLASEDGGWLVVQAKTGDALGNIYTYPIATDSKGNKLIDDNGFYTYDESTYKYQGNVMPKVVGGFSNTFTYKNFTLDFTLDYRFGGKMVSIPTFYQIGSGMFKNTLQYRDAAHGGLSYSVNSDANADYTQTSNGSRHDGVILKGVNQTSGETNSKLITAPMYYENTYSWEYGDYSQAVFNNSYIKVREVVLTYTLPKVMATAIHMQNLQFALIGRNLFYLMKTLPHGLDPETAVGSSFQSQAVDGGSAPPTRSLGVTLRASF